MFKFPSPQNLHDCLGRGLFLYLEQHGEDGTQSHRDYTENAKPISTALSGGMRHVASLNIDLPLHMPMSVFLLSFLSAKMCWVIISLSRHTYHAKRSLELLCSSKSNGWHTPRRGFSGWALVNRSEALWGTTHVMNQTSSWPRESSPPFLPVFQELGKIDRSPLLAGERLVNRCIGQAEFEATSLLAKSPCTGRNWPLVQATFVCSFSHRCMPIPGTCTSANFAPNRFGSWCVLAGLPAWKCKTVSHVFSLSYILQIVDCIAAFVTILVIDKHTLRCWWGPQERSCHEAMDKLVASANLYSIVTSLGQITIVHKPVCQPHPAKGTDHFSMYLGTCCWTEHLSPFLPFEAWLHDFLVSEFAAVYWKPPSAPVWYRPSAHPKLLCCFRHRCKPGPVLRPNRSPQYWLLKFGATTFAQRIGMRVLCILRTTDKLKIVQVVICLVAILVMNLPCVLIRRKTMEGQLHNAMDTPLLLGEMEHSVAGWMHVSEANASRWAAAPSMRTDLPCALCTRTCLAGNQLTYRRQWRAPCLFNSLQHGTCTQEKSHMTYDIETFAAGHALTSICEILTCCARCWQLMRSIWNMARRPFLEICLGSSYTWCATWLCSCELESLDWEASFFGHSLMSVKKWW